MEKLEIFDDIVRVMREDSSSCKDRFGGDALAYRACIHEDMDEKEFVFLVKSYLATFGLTGHLSFDKPGMPTIPFMVQRYENTLHVRDALSISPLQKGDKIVLIDGMSVEKFGELHKEFLFNEKEERQGFYWKKFLLPLAKNITVKRNEVEETIEVPYAEKWVDEAPLYECKDLGNGIVYMKLGDFADEVSINNMYEANAELLAEATKLIIDVRDNGGGNDSAYFPLFKYALENGKSIDESMKNPDFEDNRDSEINYSERNCELRIQALIPYLEMEIPEETKRIVNGMIDDLKANRGKGFVKTESADGDGGLDFKGDSKVSKIIVITSENCGSSGDSFVENFSIFKKVTVIGRPTMGILDYSNCIFKQYDSYMLLYPTSRLVYKEDGAGMMGKGLPVDVYIPWTPEHLERDVMLEKALELV